MGAWIEIFYHLQAWLWWFVAPHDGCVDWNNQIYFNNFSAHGRTPRWVRGLKFKIILVVLPNFGVAPHDGCVDWNRFNNIERSNAWQSHPTMGAWIEIATAPHTCLYWVGRTPRWVRGLKSVCSARLKDLKHCRTPRWVRGLKLHWHVKPHCWSVVAPHDGCVDWNINSCYDWVWDTGRTPRWVRGLKYCYFSMLFSWSVSHPTMGAWIEIAKICITGSTKGVAPHDGCVDWNFEHFCKH